jgi:hypothetical protein
MYRTAALLALLIFPALTVPAQAHRSGCHRWHSCPNDTGSYGTTSRSAATVSPTVVPASRPPVRPWSRR